MTQANLGFKYIGRMTDPDGAACVKGICGDEMEFYLIVKDDLINDIKFYTNGCQFTHMCGEATAELIINKKIDEALQLSPRQIKEKIVDLPQEHLHCTILSTIAFLNALADYLYQRGL